MTPSYHQGAEVIEGYSIQLKIDSVSNETIYFINNRTTADSIRAGKSEIVEDLFFSNRKVVKRNWKKLIRRETQQKINGKVALKLCIDKLGEVIYSELIPKESTISDMKFIKRSLISSMGYKMQADPYAPEEECGKYVLNIDFK